MPFTRPARMAIAVVTLVPLGVALGLPMPTGLRMLGAKAPQMIPWAWGINGALSVVGATLAIFIAMNWGFNTTLLAASGDLPDRIVRVPDRHATRHAIPRIDRWTRLRSPSGLDDAQRTSR